MAILLVAVIMGVGIQLTQEFRFYNLESDYLFLYDQLDICNKIQETGGLSLLIASFLSQFMWMPWVGVSIAVILYLSIGWITFKILQKKKAGITMSGLSLLPVTFLYLCLENDYYRLQGHTAFLLTLLALWGYLSISANKWKKRLLFGIVVVPVLYQLTGSVAVLFAITACMIELLDKGLKGVYALAFPLVMIIIAYLYVITSRVDTWETALTPFMYYNWPSTYFFPLYAWGMIPLLWIVACLLDKFNMKSNSVYLCSILGVLLSFYLAADLYGKVHSKGNYRYLQEQYWTEHGKWDTLIETADHSHPTYFVSYLNLALAKKGILEQRMRFFNQQPISKLMYPDPNLKNGMSLQSKVYLEWGYIGAARQAAFDANLVTAGSCNPRQLQILVQTNLVLGSYQLAEKYISWLEKTLYYKDWAKNMRKFLENPELICQDKYLGELYRSLPLTDEYVKYEGLKGDMRDILAANPTHNIISQFYNAYQIMEKGESHD